MNRKKLLFLILIVVFSVILLPCGLMELTFSHGTRDEDPDVIILEGLKGVSFEVVQPVSGYEDRPRFNPVKVEKYHVTMKKNLTESGIEVLVDTSDDPQFGHIVVTINVWKNKGIDFIVQVKTELYQQTTLVRDTNIQILTPTWPLGGKASEAQAPVIVSNNQIVRIVQQKIGTQIQMLIDDFLQANPVSGP